MKLGLMWMSLQWIVYVIIITQCYIDLLHRHNFDSSWVDFCSFLSRICSLFTSVESWQEGTRVRKLGHTGWASCSPVYLKLKTLNMFYLNDCDFIHHLLRREHAIRKLGLNKMVIVPIVLCSIIEVNVFL